MIFETKYKDILNLVETIEPERYAASRNYIDGAVTKLSPYISRGVISTRDVYESLVRRGFEPFKIQKFIQELTWRDYWQQIWIDRRESIDEYLKYSQSGVKNHQIPKSILKANTGIHAIDDALKLFYSTGYLHNHVRMYVASIVCNIGKSHWRLPAQWMYYHLLDADWASNACSWQWVAGTNSNKKYYANQENINRYCHSDQKNTFLDVAYEDFESMRVPAELTETVIPKFQTKLPDSQTIKIDPTQPTLLFTFYNLDPKWYDDMVANRILLLEPTVFDKYPVSNHTIDFILKLGENIPDLQIFSGEFHELVSQYNIQNIHYKEHPLNNHYVGKEESRDWICSIKGYYPSFFAYWKKAKKELL